MHVPYLDLRAQYETIKDEVLAAVHQVLETNAFVLGPAVSTFERDFAAFCENRHCIGTNNGTSALHLALLACGIGPGDEVITQANTFIATVAAIAYTGAKPVLVDVTPPSYAIDVDAIARAITPKTKAIIPVHLFGQPCHLDEIVALGKARGIRIIEDASQAHGATYRGRTIGSGDIATFSFYPGKNLGAAGEAGAVVTGDSEIDRLARVLRNHGMAQKYVHDVVGYNYRMEGIQGAVLGVKLGYLAEWTKQRQRVARRYDGKLANVPRPTPLDATTSAYHIYPILTKHRERVAAALQAKNIDTNIHYPIPCHLQSGYAFLGYKRGDFPHSESLAEQELSLPIYPEMSDAAIDYVAAELNAVL